MKLAKTIVSAATALFVALFMQSAAFAATSATPDPAVPDETVTITYTSEQCEADWLNLASLNEGVLAIDWPDGSQTLVDPVTNPVAVTVPSGMQVGTANISLHKAFIGNGEYTDCQGSFEIVEDATVPVIHGKTFVMLAILGFVGLGVAVTSKEKFLAKRQAA